MYHFWISHFAYFPLWVRMWVCGDHSSSSFDSLVVGRAAAHRMSRWYYECVWNGGKFHFPVVWGFIQLEQEKYFCFPPNAIYVWKCFNRITGNLLFIFHHHSSPADEPPSCTDAMMYKNNARKVGTKRDGWNKRDWQTFLYPFYRPAQNRSQISTCHCIILQFKYNLKLHISNIPTSHWNKSLNNEIHFLTI